MKVGSLFSGIGGLELALESFGHEVVWQCDNDPAALAVLAHHWPNVRRYKDVREIDANAARVDVVCGGFPCQPHSLAGRRRGTSDSRWLWPEFARIVEALSPRFVFIENVPGLRTSGLRNVLADLARLGFNAEWDLFGAYEAGAHFQGERMYLLAEANEEYGRAWLGLHREHDSPLFRQGETEGPEVWAPPAALAHREANGPQRRMGLGLMGNAVFPAQAALAWETLTARAAHHATEVAA